MFQKENFVPLNPQPLKLDITRAELPQEARSDTLRGEDLLELQRNLRRLKQHMPSAKYDDIKFAELLAQKMAQHDSLSAAECVDLMRESFHESRRSGKEERRSIAKSLIIPETMNALCLVLKYAAPNEKLEDFVFVVEDRCSNSSIEMGSLRSRIVSNLRRAFIDFESATRVEVNGNGNSQPSSEFLLRIKEVTEKIPLQLGEYEEAWWRETRKQSLAKVKNKKAKVGTPNSETEIKSFAELFLAIDRQTSVAVLHEISEAFQRMRGSFVVSNVDRFSHLFLTAAGQLSQGMPFHSLKTLKSEVAQLLVSPLNSFSESEKQLIRLSKAVIEGLEPLYAKFATDMKEAGI